MRQFGARAFDIDIDTGAGVLLPPDGRALRVDELEETAEKAGFELLGVDLEVRGRLERVRGPHGEDVPAVAVECTGQSFAILEGDTDREHEAWARLSPHLEEPGAIVSVRGRVHRHEGGPLGIFVRDFRLMDDR